MPRVEITVIVSIDGRPIWNRKADVEERFAHRLDIEEQDDIVEAAKLALEDVRYKKQSPPKPLETPDEPEEPDEPTEDKGDEPQDEGDRENDEPLEKSPITPKASMKAQHKKVGGKVKGRGKK